MNRSKELEKIFFIILAIGIIFLASKGVFAVRFADDLGLSIFSCKGGIVEVLEYAEIYDDYSESISLDLAGREIDGLHSAEWCMRIGVVGYLVAALIMCIYREWLAHVFVAIGFTLHIIWFIVCVMGLKTILGLDSAFGAVEFFSENMLWYFAMNVALVVISFIYFCDVGMKADLSGEISDAIVLKEEIDT